VIASGGFGTVYRGTDMNANAEVAIKALRSDRMSARDKEDFEKEVLCLSELSHPNIVRLLAKSVTNTRVCMVLEHAAGGSVASILAAKSSRALFFSIDSSLHRGMSSFGY
jgi:serine/threonine protein kinase